MPIFVQLPVLSVVQVAHSPQVPQSSTAPKHGSYIQSNWYAAHVSGTTIQTPWSVFRRTTSPPSVHLPISSTSIQTTTIVYSLAMCIIGSTSSSFVLSSFRNWYRLDYYLAHISLFVSAEWGLITSSSQLPNSHCHGYGISIKNDEIAKRIWQFRIPHPKVCLFCFDDFSF